MYKKILILNGSPRKNGNTAALIDSFASGAQASGHSITRFDLQEMDIHACIGCLRGGKDKKSPCTQKDDMDKIYPVYKEADILVLASPLYYWNMSAQLKIALDRIFAVTEEFGNPPPKDCIMLIAAEGTDQSNFAPMIVYYESMLKRLGWQDKGQVYAGGVFEVGDIKDKPVLDDARKLGASI